jgi:hypothetical protein
MDIATTGSESELSVPVLTSRSFCFLRNRYGFTWPAVGKSTKNTRMSLDIELVTALLQTLADSIRVDDAWYRQRYPDVEDGIRKGEFKSAKHHYVEFGYFEDRLPQYFEVDDSFYRSTYPDIAQHIETGRLESSQQHFELYGFKEGRFPSSEWRLVG